MSIAKKWLRVMGDHEACGLWLKRGGEADISKVPLSPALKERLKIWAKDYPYVEANQGTAAYTAEGLAIAQLIKAELPAWTIVYFDEEAAEGAMGVSPDRTSYEYEILS
ncbi:MAG: hypothetical protein Q7S87_09555 [Agitococcus sp.]|nr:hypothetical protein [Agitococcus sp.]